MRKNIFISFLIGIILGLLLGKALLCKDRVYFMIHKASKDNRVHFKIIEQIPPSQVKNIYADDRGNLIVDLKY